jgi:sugar-specific transcriptional regulator TrmB
MAPIKNIKRAMFIDNPISKRSPSKDMQKQTRVYTVMEQLEHETFISCLAGRLSPYHPYIADRIRMKLLNAFPNSLKETRFERFKAIQERVDMRWHKRWS